MKNLRLNCGSASEPGKDYLTTFIPESPLWRHTAPTTRGSSGRGGRHHEQWAPWRRGRDSNPRFRFPGTRALQARPFNHSGTSPMVQAHGVRGREYSRRGPHSLAERAGFEPAIPEMGIPVFETGAFNHSATSPGSKLYQRPRYGPNRDSSALQGLETACSGGSPG